MEDESIMLISKETNDLVLWIWQVWYLVKYDLKIIFIV